MGEPNLAVCLLPGTEVAFENDIEFEGGLGFFLDWKPAKRTGERVARFRQVYMDKPHLHHDALEFPNGEFVLLTRLCEGAPKKPSIADWPPRKPSIDGGGGPIGYGR